MDDNIIGIVIDSIAVIGSFVGMHKAPTFTRSFKLYLLSFIAFLWLLSGDLDILNGSRDFFFAQHPIRALGFRLILMVGIWLSILHTPKGQVYR